jgi:hypothetical protein
LYLTTSEEIARNIVTTEVQKVINNSTTITSPACYPKLLSNSGHKIDRILFHHMRKAGGTTLLVFLKNVAKRYGLTFQHVEGRPAPNRNNRNNNTLFVTNLRDPVARTISHYKYSGRWQCRDLKRKNFKPTRENDVPLETFLHEEGGDKERQRWPQAWLWECAQNCYTRWLSPNPGEAKNVNTDHDPAEAMLQRAKERLLQYDVIVVLEKLADPAYIKGLEQMFGGVPWPSKPAKVYCENQIKRANRKVPAVIRNETLQEVQRLNAADISLYKEMTSCSHGFAFPEFDPSKFGGKSRQQGVPSSAVPKKRKP